MKMIKKFGGYYFCTDRFRFLAAQAILLLAFDHAPRKKSQFLLFQDIVFNKLQEMVDKKLIDVETNNQFKKMLLPSRGISIEEKFSDQQLQRLEKARNKNHHFALSLDPVMLGLILKQMFSKDENGKLKRNILAQKALFIVGTPGIGKSVKFIGAKMFLDMRIRHLIKNGIDNSSKFSQNFKFLYLQSQSQLKDIMIRILQEVKKDFDNVPEQISKIKIGQPNFEQFMFEVSSAYQQKKIRLRLILDQINTAYNLKQSKRQKRIDRWIQISRHFVTPVIMVSSKNNPYLQKYDPVLYFANSSKNNIFHKKIILDNMISPHQRLNYTYNCLAFQLQKCQFSRNELISIIEKVSLPLLTHLSIANAVHDALKEFNNPDNQQKQQSFELILNNKLNFVETLDSLSKMMKQQTQPEKVKYNLEFMSNFLNFSCKNTKQKKIYLLFGIKNNNGKVVQIKKKIKIPYKIIKKHQKFQVVSSSNYFFTYQINGRSYLFNGTSIQQMQNIRMKIMNYLSIEYLQTLRKINYNYFQNLINNNIGLMFQAFICNLYHMNIVEKRFVLTVINQDSTSIPRTLSINTGTEEMFQVREKESYNILFKDKNQFMKNASGNSVFDFILSDFSSNNKCLILVDTTVSNQMLTIIKKISKFKRILFAQKKKQSNQIEPEPESESGTEPAEELVQKEEPTSFRNQILNLLSIDNTYVVQIIFYVLTAVKTQEPNIFENFQQSQNWALNQLKQNIKDDDKTKAEKKQEQQKILQGRQNFNQFQEELRKKGFEKRVIIKLMKGEISKQFNIICGSFSDQIQSQIKNLPKYLVESYQAINKPQTIINKLKN